MIDMTDPSIQSYERPMLQEEVQDYGILQFSEYNWVAGVALFSGSLKEMIAIPEDIGRFYTKHEYRQKDQSPSDEVTPTVPCKEAFAEFYESFTQDEEDFLQFGQCMDPSTAKTGGNDAFKVALLPILKFENCADRKASDQSTDLKCRDKDAIKEWLFKKKPTLQLVYSFNFVNFASKANPFNSRVAMQELGVFSSLLRYDYKIPLMIH